MIWKSIGRSITAGRARLVREGALPDYFLQRLVRLVEVDRVRRGSMSAAERRLVGHALYSTYWDCVAAGMRLEARSVLRTTSISV